MLGSIIYYQRICHWDAETRPMFLSSSFGNSGHKLTKEAPVQDPWVLRAQLSTSSSVRRRVFLGGFPISEIRSELVTLAAKDWPLVILSLLRNLRDQIYDRKLYKHI